MKANIDLELEIETWGNVDFKNQLTQAIGHTVQFANGCWLDLRKFDHILCGSTPYGRDWFCNANSQWQTTVIAWIGYWNTNRDEAGNIITPDQYAL